MKSDEQLDGLIGIGQARELAERQLMALVREQDSDAFTLAVTFSDSKWTIILDDLASGVQGKGQRSPKRGTTSIHRGYKSTIRIDFTRPAPRLTEQKATWLVCIRWSSYRT